jgi:membrane dipeptidase
MTQSVPIFDGHNDILLRLWNAGASTAPDRFKSSDTAHIDLQKAQKGNLIGGFFALFAPPTNGFRIPGFNPPYDHPLPPMLDQPTAVTMITEQAGVMAHLDRLGLLAICTTKADIDAARQAGRIAAIMHLEGAEAIDPELAILETLHRAGLRSLGPVWSRPTIFGHGVPFRYPSDPDIGSGLTDAGKALIERCKQLRMIVDTSHLNLAGFNDVANAGLPLVATHSNAHAISPGARNLTDEQLSAIGQTGGMAGLNYGTMFLRPDGRAKPQGGLEAAIRHLSHMVEKAGEDHVGLGSDFDGAPMPENLSNAGELQNLVQAMRDHQFGEKLIAKITHENWLGFIERSLG